MPPLGELARPYVRVARFAGELAVRRATRQPRFGAWLRQRLVDMGPTYVKLGQVAATRKDLFATDVTEALETLQDRMDAVPFDAMDAVFRDEMGAGLREYFEWVDETPVACASIAQVYTAGLRGSGRRVAVKIQKPGVADALVGEARAVGEVLRWAATLTRARWAKDMAVVAQTLADGLAQEVDFEAEALNMRRFRTAARGEVVVPRVWWGARTRRVLVMEYVRGRRVSAAAGGAEAVEALMVAFMRLVVEEGALHADLHAGNVAVTADGRLVLYDFGLVTWYDAARRGAFKRVVRGFMFRNTHDVIECLLASGLVVPVDDAASGGAALPAAAYVALHALIGHAYAYTETTDLAALARAVRADPFVSSSALPFYVDAEVVLLFKTIGSLEGLCKEVDPSFSYARLYARLLAWMVDIDLVADKVSDDLGLVRAANEAAAAARLVDARARMAEQRAAAGARRRATAGTALALALALASALAS